MITTFRPWNRVEPFQIDCRIHISTVVRNICKFSVLLFSSNFYLIIFPSKCLIRQIPLHNTKYSDSVGFERGSLQTRQLVHGQLGVEYTQKRAQTEQSGKACIRLAWQVDVLIVAC
jgi:hypothetical protein